MQLCYEEKAYFPPEPIQNTTFNKHENKLKLNLFIDHKLAYEIK